MIYASPFFMKAELFPVYDLLEKVGGNTADMFILLIIAGFVALAVVVFKMLRKSINDMQTQQTAALNEVKESMKDSLNRMALRNTEDISAIRGILEELREDKMWTETCAERHDKIDDKFVAIEEWRKETVDTLKRHEDKIFVLGQNQSRRASGE